MDETSINRIEAANKGVEPRPLTDEEISAAFQAAAKIPDRTHVRKRKPEPINIQSIGYIGNYYGGLEVGELDGKFYWGIEGHDGIGWQEISEELHAALLKHNETVTEETK